MRVETRKRTTTMILIGPKTPKETRIMIREMRIEVDRCGTSFGSGSHRTNSTLLNEACGTIGSVRFGKGVKGSEHVCHLIDDDHIPQYLSSPIATLDPDPLTRTSRLRLVSDALVGFKRQRGLPSCKAEMAFGILSFRRRSEKLRRHDFGRLYAKKDA